VNVVNGQPELRQHPVQCAGLEFVFRVTDDRSVRRSIIEGTVAALAAGSVPNDLYATILADPLNPFDKLTSHYPGTSLLPDISVRFNGIPEAGLAIKCEHEINEASQRHGQLVRIGRRNAPIDMREVG
jgi:hypothetical protein